MKGFVTYIFFPALLGTVIAAPTPQDNNPFAVIGNFIQRLQTNFNEGSESVRQNIDNGIYPLVPESPNRTTIFPSTTTSKPTTTPRTTTSPPTQRPRPSNPFDSINAILDNISRGSSNTNNVPVKNNIFGSVPGRNIPDSSFSTPRPFFPPPPPPTTRPPFSLDGINQGINAFFQAFLKTNIQKLFQQGQDDSKHSITTRSDPPLGPPPPNIGLGEGSRLEALLRAVVYVLGVPILIENFYNEELSSPGSCYDDLGCFKIRYAQQKGYNITANALDDVLPHICLFTKAISQTCQVVEPEEEVLHSQSLRISNGSVFWIAHGYIENSQRPWIKALVNELLEYDNYANVFVVDWSEASKPPYNQAVENLEMIAAYCANAMVIMQKEYNLLINETHVIGHSLGAQLAGYLGSWLKEKHSFRVGRITGLDPAQLYFQGLPNDAKLDPSDGIFVDVIHTDAKPFLNGGEVASKSSSRPVSGLGTQEPSGHADFFPNGGKDQPGCKDGVYQAILQEEGSVINGIRRFLGCDHIRSYEYFTESIRSSCPYMSFTCESWEAFTESTCQIGTKNKMGFFATKPEANSSVIYYSITGPRAPFCREHYKVVINLAEESKYRSTAELYLVLGNITSSKGDPSSVLNLGPIDFTGKDLARKFTVSGSKKRMPSRITLRPSSSNPLRWLMNKMAAPADPDVIVANVTLYHMESDEYIEYCPSDKNHFSATEQNPSISFSRGKCE